MYEIKKIFIGADQYGADFPELERLQKISKIEGFTSFRNWINIMNEFGEYQLSNKTDIC